MSSSDNEGNPYYCIPLTKSDLSFNLEHILSLASEPRHLPFQMGGNNMVVFPKAPPIETVGGEISVPKYTGKLPILPCLHSAIMTENPSHMARAYLVSWYRDLLTGRQPINSLKEKQEVLDLIVAEIKQLVESNDEIWLDWDEEVEPEAEEDSCVKRLRLMYEKVTQHKYYFTDFSGESFSLMTRNVNFYLILFLRIIRELFILFM